MKASMLALVFLLLLCLPVSAFADTITARMTVGGGSHHLDAIVLLQPSIREVKYSWMFEPALLNVNLVTFLEGTFDGQPIISGGGFLEGFFPGSVGWQTATKLGFVDRDLPSSTVFTVVTLPPPVTVEEYFGVSPSIQVLHVPEPATAITFLIGLVGLACGVRGLQLHE